MRIPHADRICACLHRRAESRLAILPLKKAECKRIYEEHGSGKDSARLELLSCLKALRAGDVLVVWRLDRLGRGLSDLVHIAGQMEQRKIGLESVTEKIETVSSAGKLVFHVFAALAEFERNVIRERTVAGLKAARARGRLGGRPEKISAKTMSHCTLIRPCHERSLSLRS